MMFRGGFSDIMFVTRFAFLFSPAAMHVCIYMYARMGMQVDNEIARHCAPTCLNY